MSTVYSNNILGKLEEELISLQNQCSEKKIVAEKSIGLCQLAFLDTKRQVIQNGFKCIEEEIYFFKVYKPEILSKLIFYNELFRIETFKPLIHKKMMMGMLKNEIRKIHEFIRNNKEFYQYYTTGQTCLDEVYFTRNDNSLLMGSENFHYLTDPQFATPRDEIVSYIIAFEQLGKYIDDEITILKNRGKRCQSDLPKILNFKMSWTASKVALIELIYALHCCCCINNGKVHINELIGFFEVIFDVKLCKAYRTFVDIKDRKKEKAIFLTELKDVLINKLDALDDLN